MTADVPPCPWCKTPPSPTGCVHTWDLREVAASETTIQTVPVLIFCSQPCATAFWDKVAEELKNARTTQPVTKEN